MRWRPLTVYLLLAYLLLAEGLSWFMAGGLGPCAIDFEQSQQTANDNEHHRCPTFLAGSLLILSRGFHWIKTEDNDKAVVAGFTIVLAVSTIGLWFSTNALYRAGERQLDHIKAEAESADYYRTAQFEQISTQIEALQQSAEAAERNARETERLVWQAQRNAQTALRAYVSVESGAMFRQSKKRGMHFEFRPNVINNGQTPANDVKIASRMRVIAPDDVQGFDYNLPASQWASVTTVGPRQSRFHAMVLNRALGIGDLRQIQKGAHVFHLYGSVTYSDVFNTIRKTNFSFIIFPGKHSQAAVWHYTAEHNDAD